MLRFSGQKLRDIRERSGMTQEQVADAVGVKRSLYAHWEQDRLEPKVAHLALLAEVLGAPVGKFFEGDHAETLTEAEERELRMILDRASEEQKQLFIRMLRAAVSFRFPDEEAACLVAS